MIEGICPQCKVHYHGQALGTKSNQLCLKCGSTLEIRNNGVLVRTALSPFKYKEYRVDTDQEEWEDLCTKNLLIYLILN
jgi:transcription initiation factor IIE alpha subunit